MGASSGRLSSPSMSRGGSSDPTDPDTSDTLISALELVLKIAARAPCFKVRFFCYQRIASATPRKGACPHMDSTQPSSDDETSDFPGLHNPSEDFASDLSYPDNLLPTRFYLSGLSLAQLFDDVSLLV
jgi:hypothetical protein